MYPSKVCPHSVAHRKHQKSPKNGSAHSSCSACCEVRTMLSPPPCMHPKFVHTGSTEGHQQMRVQTLYCSAGDNVHTKLTLQLLLATPSQAQAPSNAHKSTGSQHRETCSTTTTTYTAKRLLPLIFFSGPSLCARALFCMPKHALLHVGFKTGGHLVCSSLQELTLSPHAVTMRKGLVR